MTDLEKMTRKFNMMKQSRDKFRTENKELKKGGHDSYIRNITTIKKLKEANEEIEKLKYKIGDLDWSLLDAETEKKKALEERQNYYFKIEELKKENRRLLEREGELEWDVADASLKNKALQENEKLKKEINQLKERDEEAMELTIKQNEVFMDRIESLENTIKNIKVVALKELREEIYKFPKQYWGRYMLIGSEQFKQEYYSI
jgi:chromosome segregation ATPase